MHAAWDMHSVHLQDAIKDVQSNLKASIQELRSSPETRANYKGPLENVETVTRAIQFLQWHVPKRTDIGIHIAVLDSLHFTGMGNKFHNVARSFGDTYKHIFHKLGEGRNWVQWLTGNEKLFWISGKPGSGKSTLMKFFIANDDTQCLLREWAGSRRLVMTCHFFWVNGSEVSRSMEGLFRSICYDILRQYPELASRAAKYTPALMRNAAEDMSDSHARSLTWSVESMMNFFCSLTTETEATHCFALFMDGLDEYDGSHSNLVENLQRLVKLSNVKLCLASRPWNVFEHAFGSVLTNKLYLQDFNRRDIAAYVRERLQMRADYQNMRHECPGADILAEEIVEKSQGVFLWTHLVVQSLINGLENADQMTDLLRRLRQFPSDLTEFFTYILKSLDDFYKQAIGRGFQTMLCSYVHAPQPSLMKFWFVDMEDEKPGYVTEAITTSFDHNTHGTALNWSGAIASQMKTRINARFKGLLEVQMLTAPQCDPQYSGGEETFAWKVDYLHRTVKDFLLTTDARDIISPYMHGTGKAHELLCCGALAELYLRVTKYTFGTGEIIQKVANEILFHAREYEISSQNPLIKPMITFHRIVDSQQGQKCGFHDEQPLLREIQWTLERFLRWRLDTSVVDCWETTHLSQAISVIPKRFLTHAPGYIDAGVETLRLVLQQRDWSFPAARTMMVDFAQEMAQDASAMQQNNVAQRLGFLVLLELCKYASHTTLDIEHLESLAEMCSTVFSGTQYGQLMDFLDTARNQRRNRGTKRRQHHDYDPRKRRRW